MSSAIVRPLVWRADHTEIGVSMRMSRSICTLI